MAGIQDHEEIGAERLPIDAPNARDLDREAFPTDGIGEPIAELETRFLYETLLQRDLRLRSAGAPPLTGQDLCVLTGLGRPRQVRLVIELVTRARIARLVLRQCLSVHVADPGARERCERQLTKPLRAQELLQRLPLVGLNIDQKMVRGGFRQRRLPLDHELRSDNGQQQ